VTGKVYLVGAGPGDPELLTVKAAGLLRTADTVLHDDLVSQEVLNLISIKTEVRNVGKRCGNKKISQAEIDFLMIEFARQGKKVVRLKSGDPLIFGRLGEEIEALRRAEVDFEVVPGVTSAFGAAATAQIPLTHRHASSALIMLTGHHAEENEESDWRKFVASGATLVIYMPGREYQTIARRLRRAGAYRDTPCAIISRATELDQQTFLTCIADLAEAPHLPAPTLLIVGDVVRFAAEFGAQHEQPTSGVQAREARERNVLA
jgi:uroporphyrin-III C-methyltransferase